ncbi:single-stranded-DNA-specific exonuclease RecJ [Mucilaginibacter arboris]|uniref:Single-stranded-DNA-specific exonuclease RecJ n=1 Tax=Mucilaginibacter arboris TaxID=2682090 RepID=A0A7K1STV9_9SPHI|nr:single-stranded-DNA-specific exonuclease RecJ [Mucilaginibacter arboris]MVN20698.1 single-stranded-DNA-specific exonuclease RecJ [Mucilaginibacter arboris]
MQKRWIMEEEGNPQQVAALAEALHVDEALSNLLVQRGVTSFEEAKYFFRPALNHLHDPFLMQDMEKAVLRIEKAIQNQEKILIYGDYDVDGTTAVSVVYQFFKKLYENISFYIPNRYTEGYGISTAGIDFAAENNFSLIIALDCGIKSVDKVFYAGKRSIDFIICDHHLPGTELPEAVAVLDPKRSDCSYPYKELSGCGIGFKLIQAYAEKNNIPFEEVTCYLDLVAVSIACDLVHINGENRTLAAFGLQKLNSNPSIGLEALMNVAGKSESYTISDLVFTIGPRINAAGRIDDAKHAVNLLIADCADAAFDNGELINLKNTERKEHDLSITGQALNMIGQDQEMINRRSTVVYQENWHKGVIGIVASRLTEKYYRPTIVLTKSNGHVAGSARSVHGFDLYEALCGCSDLLLQFGGHKYAAGLTLLPENVPAFSQRFEQVVASAITDEQLIQRISIDAELNLNQITPKFCRILKQFAPFGPENMAPVFVSKNVYVSGPVTLVGSNHLKLCVVQDGSPVFNCIGFGLGENILAVKNSMPFDICYTIEENSWKEQKTLQLNLKGIRVNQENAAI